jgi:uncharacterized protein DUF1028
VSFGPRALELLRQGASAEEAARGLIADDPLEGVRQVAVLSAADDAFMHTGSACVPAAGHVIGDGVAVQGNMLANEGVWPAMLDGHAAAAGDLAARPLAALDAAEEAGGDIRGRQSAALLVVRGGEPTERPWEEPIVDVRVDDHPPLLPELRRLAHLNAWYNDLLEMFTEPGLLGGELTADPAKVEEALEHLRAGQALLGDNQEATFWLGVLLARTGREDEARMQLASATAARPLLGEFLRRLAGTGTFAEPGLAERLVPPPA